MEKQREDKFRTHRLIQIDKLIRSGTFPTTQNLMDEYGVSRRTIMRDFEFLRDRYDAPLVYDTVHNGYAYTDPTFMIQNVLLTEGDLFTVSTLMPLMEQYKNTPLEDSFKNIMSKISEMLPQTVSVDTSFLNKDVKFISDPLPEIKSEVFNLIFKAVKLKKVLGFNYRSLDQQEYKFRILDCYQVLCQKGNWYVFGYEHGAKDYRVFALSRMKDLDFTDQNFTIPENFDIEKYIDPSFGIWNNKEDPVEYELLFAPRLYTYITERQWHENQKVSTLEDGSVILKFSSNQKQQICSWVLSFGSNVKVIKPESLIRELKETLSRTQELYK